MTIYTITSTVRGGGTGARAWVAKITGADEKFGFQREFVKKDRALSRSGKSGAVHFHINEPGIYEYRGVQLPRGEARIGALSAGFLRVTSDGVEEITKSDAEAATV